MKHRIAILHGAGYVGKELIRLVLQHAHLELQAVSSRSQKGKQLWQVHPELLGLSDLHFSEDVDFSNIDAVFVAAEHGKSMSVISELIQDGFKGQIIDMSADFRLRDTKVYKKVYGQEHVAKEINDSFVYGLTEVNRSSIANSQWVGNPGCFATAISLALFPLAEKMGNGLIKKDIMISAITGASGSGAQASATTHFPTRDGNIRAYKVLEHRHQAEVNQILGGSDSIRFLPISGPWVRGIWGNAQLAFEGHDPKTLFDEAYSEEHFVRVHHGNMPEMRWSQQTPFADIGWVQSGDRLVVGFAIDNLMKGAASQAIQNLNVMLGLDERTGLIPF